MLEPHRRGQRRRGHGGAGAGAGRRAAAGAATSCRPAAHVLVCDPERVRTRAADLVPHVRGVPAGVLGGGGRRRHRRRSTSARRRCARWSEVRDDAAALGIPWWTLSPFAADDSLGSTDALAIDATPAEAYRGDTDRAIGRRAGVDPRRLAGRAGLRGTRPGAARGGAARRGARCRCAAVPVAVGRARAGLRHGLHRPARRRLRRARAEARRARPRPTSPASAASRPRDMQRMPSRRGATRSTRSQLQARRPRRARAARRRPVRRDGAAHGQRRRARVPHHRVRPGTTGPAGRPAVRADRLARPAHPVRRRRGARRSTGSAARTGRRRRAGPARRSRRSPAS